MSISLREYVSFDATGLADLVKTGQVTPQELLDAALQVHHRTDDRINAINRLMLSEARRDMERIPANAPFCGVPFLMKDLLCAYEGVPMSCGSRALKDWKPSGHSFITRRFLDAGFIPFGKTSVPECGLLATTEPEAFGPTRNPWDTTCSAGGSSGGSAAAVASRVVPVASAGDGGGSIRIPASVNGLFGLKPTRGRVSNGPFVGESWNGAVCQHVLTRSVRDSAAILDVIAGYNPGDPYTAPDPGDTFLSALHMKTRPLRVAVAGSSPHGLRIDGDTRLAMTKCVSLLSDLGHRVEEVEPALDMRQLLDDYLMLYFGAVAADLAQWEEWLGGLDVSTRVEPATLLLRRIGQKLPVEKVERAARRWNDYACAMAKLHETHDVYLLPVNAVSRWRVGEMSLSPIESFLIRFADKFSLNMFFSWKMAHRRSRMMLALVPFTQLANLTGQPAMSIPMHWCEDGFPVGVQMLGRFGDERSLLCLARQLEEANPWAHRMPPVLSAL
jgi:amidase